MCDSKALRNRILRLALRGMSSGRILREVQGIDSRQLEMKDSGSPPFPEDEQLIYWRKLEELGAWFMTPYDSGYPDLLREIADPLAILFGLGDQELVSGFCLAVVGTRKASDYGCLVCKNFVEDLVREGVTIVSGLARGIDTVAHRSCLDRQGKTIAVLGCGIDRVYPRANRGLMKEIAERGCLITEFPPQAPPLAFHFHRRNRILSGLSAGVLVVEASRKSGTMITAKFAADQGRDVFAIPGNINQPRSRGTNELIQMGAKLVMDPGEILIEYGRWPGTEAVDSSEAKDLTDEERIVYDTLLDGPLTIDEVVDKSGLPIGRVSACLTILELKACVCTGGSGKYERSSSKISEE